jgi:hypothetical protein
MGGLISVEPFEYPLLPHRRKHGPVGYTHWSGFKDWLRDEFDFRCVYCMRREIWDRKQAIWVVEHLKPRCSHPHLTTVYSNLVLACAACNSCKSSDAAPDPCRVGFGTLVTVAQDGSITSHDPLGVKLIRAARLDDRDSNDWRRAVIGIMRSLKKNDPALYLERMGFPIHDLPDLKRRRQKGNTKPKGVLDCRFEQYKAGKLPFKY